MTKEMLPRELVWEGTHVSELGLTALADGQDAILGDDAVAHVQACERCTGRLVRVALVSSAVGEALVVAKPARAKAAAPAPRPWRALISGLVVAVLAAVPTAHDVLRAPAVAAAFATHAAKALARSGVALATSDAVARELPPATFAASALLVLMGWMIARRVSRQPAMVSEGSRS
jgi:hypothetical protein